MKINVGLLVICLGKYDVFLQPLAESADKFFMPNANVTIFCFTDKEIPECFGRIKIVRVKLNPEAYKPFFPYATLKRYHMFYENRALLLNMDYLFYSDVDMRFVSIVADEILPDSSSNGLVGTQHPGFVGRRGTYDINRKSTAFVSPNEGLVYYAGGFNGGSSEEFLSMAQAIQKNVDIDAFNGVMALWHDESHMNRYFIDHPPKTLSPSYCYPESMNLPFEKKLLALDKNHKEIRSEGTGLLKRFANMVSIFRK